VAIGSKLRGRKVIKFSEYQRLCACNSDKVPDYVEMQGKRYHWVGIGVVESGDPEPDDPVVVDDKDYDQRVRDERKKATKGNPWKKKKKKP
jgi:hypothetical protein